jgi:hypothetical protein
VWHTLCAVPDLWHPPRLWPRCAVLLYIGLTSRIIGQRLKEHTWWVKELHDQVTVRLGSLDKFTTWEDWERNDDAYDKAPTELVKKIEALLIYAHKPAYNTHSKKSIDIAEGIRIFNTGNYGQLLPEVSYTYYWGD